MADDITSLKDWVICEKNSTITMGIPLWFGILTVISIALFFFTPFFYFVTKASLLESVCISLAIFPATSFFFYALTMITEVYSDKFDPRCRNPGCRHKKMVHSDSHVSWCLFADCRCGGFS